MPYPHLKLHTLPEELAEHFSLTADDRLLIDRIHRPRARLGFAVLLKSTVYLGYPARRKGGFLPTLVAFVAGQLGLDPELWREYKWKGRQWERHLALIRRTTGFRPWSAEHNTALVSWLKANANEYVTRPRLLDAAVGWCRGQHVELPSERELRRCVNSARGQFFSTLFHTVSSRLDKATREGLEELVRPRSAQPVDLAVEPIRYQWLKKHPGKMGIKTLREEVRKLEDIRTFKVDAKRHFARINPDIIQYLRDRARVEDAARMRQHRPAVRQTLLAALLHHRGMEVTDGIIRAFLEHIRRIEKRTDRALERRLLADVPTVYGKQRILYKLAKASTGQPDGSCREVLFPEVSEATLLQLVEEFESKETRYDISRSQVMREKYSTTYRRAIKPVLDVLTFRTNNSAYHSLIEGVKVVQRQLRSTDILYPAGTKIPEDLLTDNWPELVWVTGPDDGPRIVKQYFELCVLQKLEGAIKCKEVWVEGSYRYRNPDEDMPTDWADMREEHYRKLRLPLDADVFVDPLKKEMTEALEDFERFQGDKPDVTIFHPGGGKRGVFKVPKLDKNPEPPIMHDIKTEVQKRWGMLDLLDILVEADRRLDFMRFFHTSAQRQILGPEDLRERMLLTIFSLGTNIGLKRLHSAANPSCSYADLRWFRTRFLHADSLREAIAALVSYVLELRDPKIWGEGTACASDGKQLGAWDQNLVAEWNPYYNRRGIMVYWHVDTNALCIYSKIKTISSSEVATMIEGLVRHDTEMRVEKNFVDSHGQSEVAFAFCRLLGFELMPRLKRIKHQRLYLPGRGMRRAFRHLAGVLEHPINWALIREQYDEIVRHVVALAEHTGPVDSILRRFSKYNKTHPTYLACLELGKAVKTIFLCRYLSSPALRQEVHAGLNVVENWNGTVEFVHYGRKTEVVSNDPEVQELSILCLHLLQNTIILSNTVMVERVLQEAAFLDRLAPEERRWVTSLFTSHINPYGGFALDLVKPSFLSPILQEVAA
jgi:TnpA family transposase